MTTRKPKAEPTGVGAKITAAAEKASKASEELAASRKAAADCAKCATPPAPPAGASGISGDQQLAEFGKRAHALIDHLEKAVDRLRPPVTTAAEPPSVVDAEPGSRWIQERGETVWVAGNRMTGRIIALFDEGQAGRQLTITRGHNDRGFTPATTPPPSKPQPPIMTAPVGSVWAGVVNGEALRVMVVEDKDGRLQRPEWIRTMTSEGRELMILSDGAIAPVMQRVDRPVSDPEPAAAPPVHKTLHEVLVQQTSTTTYTVYAESPAAIDALGSRNAVIEFARENAIGTVVDTDTPRIISVMRLPR